MSHRAEVVSRVIQLRPSHARQTGHSTGIKLRGDKISGPYQIPYYHSQGAPGVGSQQHDTPLLPPHPVFFQHVAPLFKHT